MNNSQTPINCGSNKNTKQLDCINNIFDSRYLHSTGHFYQNTPYHCMGIQLQIGKTEEPPDISSNLLCQ